MLPSMNGNHDRELQIAQILARHGLTYLMRVLGLSRLVSGHQGQLGRSPEETPAPAKGLRSALEELGPAFIKLGQLVSTRADLLPPEYRRELAKLQDDAPRIPAEVVRGVLRRELGDRADAAFAAFDPEPLAAASIGQAHGATLQDGTEVIVKVRRPGAAEAAEEDLVIFQRLAARAAGHSELASQFDVVGLADEFALTLRAQLDYLNEAHNAERFAANFAGDQDVQIPRVFWELTTSRVVTLERIKGMKITDGAALRAAAIDRHALAQRATRVIAKMVFEDGFFHADPHPGNFFVEATGRLGIIDFGLVGILDDELRERLAMVLIAVFRRDPDRLARALLTLGVAPPRIDVRGLRDALVPLLAEWPGSGAESLQLGTMIANLLEVVRVYRLSLPRDLVLLLRAIMMEEGMARELDPTFELGQELAPYVHREILGQLSPATLGRHLQEVGLELGELSIALPNRLRRLLRAAAGDGVSIHLSQAELQPLMMSSKRLGNRITVSVVGSAIITAGAALTAAGRRPVGRWPNRLLHLAVIALVAAGSGYVGWKIRSDVAGVAARLRSTNGAAGA